MSDTTWRPPRPRSGRPAFLTLSLAVSLTVSSCGSGPKAPALARVDARPLASLAARIAREGPCAQRRDIALLQRRAVALVNARRVPAVLQDPLMSGVNALAANSPPCVPAVPTTPAPPPPPPPGPPGHDHAHGPGHGHGHGHGEGD